VEADELPDVLLVLDHEDRALHCHEIGPQSTTASMTVA